MEKRVLTRGAPDSGFHYPAGYRIGRIVKNVRPDSDYVKANTADIIFREGMNEARGSATGGDGGDASPQF